MNQRQWTYRDEQGKNHLLGVAHGADTGHLMIYCDEEIVLIDFNIFGDREYSFLVENELLKIKILSNNQTFEYQLIEDTTADTPLNRTRRTEERQERQRLVLSAVLVFLLLVGIFLFVKYNGGSSPPD